ncbi:hypothetical protein DKX38_002450 [Salix brachista]|uniref:Uncharacterized protein n=1 Tax=Salix brachista TaxID=2182728 RepID=A0A5N5NNP3_9ROSI|nr:hypothetical protein DKX38_002450 [Salix brachista]
MSAEKKAVPSLMRVKYETSYGKGHDLLLRTVLIAYKEQRSRVADIVKNGIATQVEEHIGGIGGPDQVRPHFKLSGQQLDLSSATDSFEGVVNRWHIGPKWLPLSICACSKSNGTCRLGGGGLGHCHHHLAGNGCFSFPFRPSLAVESESDDGAPESGRAFTPLVESTDGGLIATPAAIHNYADVGIVRSNGRELAGPHVGPTRSPVRRRLLLLFWRHFRDMTKILSRDTWSQLLPGPLNQEGAMQFAKVLEVDVMIMGKVSSCATVAAALESHRDVFLAFKYLARWDDLAGEQA